MTKLDTLETVPGDNSVLPGDADGENDIAARPPRRRVSIISAPARVMSGTALIRLSNGHLRMDTGGLNPRWWPTVLSILASVLSSILIGMSMFGPAMSRGELESGHHDGWVRMALALALSALYVLAWGSIGYVIP